MTIDIYSAVFRFKLLFGLRSQFYAASARPKHELMDEMVELSAADLYKIEKDDDGTSDRINLA